ncbi:DNA cytosine methyltransferase [Deinococcus sp. 6YEL10]|uniref:DNA cytosine methyltransferase n=1 Tax=Deinococcus sp. 6YEL10 TaxID=2745870 RepID=UPI001E3AB4F4
MNAPEAFYLSEKACRGVLVRAERNERRGIPDLLRLALEQQIERARATGRVAPQAMPTTYTLMTAQAHGKYIEGDAASTLRARDGKGGTVDLIVEAVDFRNMTVTGDHTMTLQSVSANSGISLNKIPGLIEQRQTPGGGTHYYVRRLTPLEGERLQGFPDNWTLVPYRNGVMGATHRYRFAGNAVTVNVFVPVAEAIRAALQPAALPAAI